MDIVTKIVSIIAATIGVLSAVGIMLGVKDIRSGMQTDDPRKTDKGIEAVVVGGVFMLIAAGVGAYIIVQLNAIKF